MRLVYAIFLAGCGGLVPHEPVEKMATEASTPDAGESCGPVVGESCLSYEQEDYQIYREIYGCTAFFDCMPPVEPTCGPDYFVQALGAHSEFNAFCCVCR